MDAGSSFAISGVLNIFISLVFIALTWWALQTFKFDLFLARPDSAQGKLLLILLSIAIGNGVAEFFRQYLGWSLMLKMFF
ncbi:DUF1146 family protein [Microaerobacter geothermalis]|uniref:DUF1146 family protein n=1 Tax=Microaerobacter geothermalis TaxID=674972 RepID=UPI001F3DE4A0|nr:DUF1146 family protein [Microaerobacter geothermalis]MCF6093240.1 DUF1146 family protein [Microaerobacter geothermalis]